MQTNMILMYLNEYCKKGIFIENQYKPDWYLKIQKKKHRRKVNPKIRINIQMNFKFR